MMLVPAYVPAPLPDEPLNGWLSRAADGIQSTRADLLRHWGVRLRTDETLLRDNTGDDFQHLSHITDIAASRLREMTLARWETIGLKPAVDKRGHAGGAWARGSGSRHCVECLAEREGIFKLHWFLHWSFACTRHRVLLTPTGHASHPTHRAFGTSLAEPPSPLPDGHPILDAQKFIDGVLDDPTRPVRSLGRSRPSREFMNDLGHLVRLVGYTYPRSRFEDLATRLDEAEDGWLPLLKDVPAATTSAAAQLGLAVQHPVLVALLAVNALRALRAESPDAAAPQLWWMSRPIVRDQLTHHRGMSYPLLRAISHGVERRGHLLVFARFSRTTYTTQNVRIPPLDPVLVPSSAWTTVHLDGPQPSSGIGQVAVSAALVNLGTGQAIDAALSRLGLGHLSKYVEANWTQAFAPTTTGDNNFDHLLRLHEAMRDGAVPIDYDRRRSIFANPRPLGRNTLKRLERQTGTQLSARSQAFIAWWLWELLTGSDALLTEHGVEGIPGTWRVAYRNQRDHWQTVQPALLAEVAEGSLFRARIDEPLTWQPLFVEGQWDLSSTGAPRLLDGWATTTRVMSGTARPPSAVALGLSLEAAVAFASHSTTRTARRVADRLTRFAAVATHRTVHEAARHLGIGQPAVSRALGQLDIELGVTTFDQRGGRLTLTPDGTRLLKVIRAEAPHLIL